MLIDPRLATYLDERLQERRAVQGAVSECLYWAGVLNTIKGGGHLPSGAPGMELCGVDPEQWLTECLLELHEADQDRLRFAAVESLRILADYLERGGRPPDVLSAIEIFHQER